MASRPTTSTHWALCSRGSRWALSSSFRLWILPAWWDGTHTHTHNRQCMREGQFHKHKLWLVTWFPSGNSQWLHSCFFFLFFFLNVGSKVCSRIGVGGQPALGHVDYKSWCSFPSSPRWPLRFQTPNWTLSVPHFPIFSWPDLRYYLAGPMALPSPLLQKPAATMTSTGITATP